MLKEAEVRKDPFTPYFMDFDFYPSELLESIQPSELSNKKAKPFWYSYAFEAVCKAELNTALGSYKKRIGA
jgi:hypothetical protein